MLKVCANFMVPQLIAKPVGKLRDRFMFAARSPQEQTGELKQVFSSARSPYHFRTRVVKNGHSIYCSLLTTCYRLLLMGIACENYMFSRSPTRGDDVLRELQIFLARRRLQWPGEPVSMLFCSLGSTAFLRKRKPHQGTNQLDICEKSLIGLLSVYPFPEAVSTNGGVRTLSWFTVCVW